MGNCMVVQEVELVRPDGKKILEYTSPVILHQESQLKKKQQLEEEEEEEEGSNIEGDSNGGVVRIKVVISKQELQELLLKKVSVSEMVSQLQRLVQRREEDEEEEGDQFRDYQERVISWKPVLESIPEMDCSQ